MHPAENFKWVGFYLDDFYEKTLPFTTNTHFRFYTP